MGSETSGRRDPESRALGGILILTALLFLAANPRAASKPDRESGLDRTILTGSIREPLTGEGLPSSSVRLLHKQRLANAEGAFRIAAGRSAPPILETSFSEEGHLPYRSWTPRGGKFTREVFLFPTGMIEIETQGRWEGGEGLYRAETLIQQFDVVYRSDYENGDGRLKRWVEQPEISIGSHVIEAVTDDSGRWQGVVATDKVVPRIIIRRFRESIRATLGPLTNGFLDGRRVRLLKMVPGEFVARSLEEMYPEGTLRFYLAGNSGGAFFTDGDVIVSGGVTIQLHPHLEMPGLNHLVVHEMAHALGMLHPQSHLGVPMCSIIASTPCEGGLRTTPVTAVDVITARLAYSRLPGNDRQDRDLPGVEPGRPAALSGSLETTGLRIHAFDSWLPESP